MRERWCSAVVLLWFSRPKTSTWRRSIKQERRRGENGAMKFWVKVFMLELLFNNLTWYNISSQRIARRTHEKRKKERRDREVSRQQQQSYNEWAWTSREVFERERMGRRIFLWKLLLLQIQLGGCRLLFSSLERCLITSLSFSAVCPGYDVKSTLAIRIREREAGEDDEIKDSITWCSFMHQWNQIVCVCSSLAFVSWAAFTAPPIYVDQEEEEEAKSQCKTSTLRDVYYHYYVSSVYYAGSSRQAERENSPWKTFLYPLHEHMECLHFHRKVSSAALVELEKRDFGDDSPK